MPTRTRTRERALHLSARGLMHPLLAGLLLAGCGGAKDTKELEARIAAAEAKAEAAEKRAQQALSMAMNGSSTGQFSSESEVVGGQDDMMNDSSDNDGSFDNQLESPAGPMIPSG